MGGRYLEIMIINKCSEEFCYGLVPRRESGTKNTSCCLSFFKRGEITHLYADWTIQFRRKIGDVQSGAEVFMV